MSKRIELPDIPEAEQTPLVKELVGLIETLSETVGQQAEEIKRLRDEVAVLKGQKKRPRFKPSQLDQKAGQGDKDSSEGKKRPGSAKRSKTAELTIHEAQVIAPREAVPAGSRFKGYRDVVVQDLVIHARNTRYRLERWQTPDGQTLGGELPAGVTGHFGPTLQSYVLYQHHHCQVTQPLLREQLGEWGVEISAGQIDALLTADQADFHAEKAALLSAGVGSTKVLTVDDTGARHGGKNGYTTQIGNEFFAWFGSTGSKSRLNFLQLLRADHTDYRIDEDALAYMAQQKLPKGFIARLQNHPTQHFADDIAWEVHLVGLGFRQARHRQMATEGALLASALSHGLPRDLAIVSDGAGQFKLLLHGLCWVHTERLIHRLIPLNEAHREDLATVRRQIWDLYADLKRYQAQPTPAQKAALEVRFDAIFTQATRYETLNRTLKRLHSHRAELLLVLERPEIPLHTNGSEQDLRDAVKKRKVSGGTRSELGRRCRDTFMSLKRTCRKLGLSFWHYLTDRIGQTHEVPQLPELIRQRAAASS